MNHLSEEQLVELYYGRGPDPHLAQCAACQAQFRDLEEALSAFDDLPVPEPPPFHWRAPLSYRLRNWKLWLAVPALAAALCAAFFLGRGTQSAPPAPIQLADSGRERILLVALGDHFERSQMVLLEAANGNAGASAETQERARSLLGTTRLYRQNTFHSGDQGYTDLLDELDRVLTAVANGQSESATPEAERIERLLFKLRVTDSNLQKGTEKL